MHRFRRGVRGADGSPELYWSHVNGSMSPEVVRSSAEYRARAEHQTRPVKLKGWNLALFVPAPFPPDVDRIHQRITGYSRRRVVRAQWPPKGGSCSRKIRDRPDLRDPAIEGPEGAGVCSERRRRAQDRSRVALVGVSGLIASPQTQKFYPTGGSFVARRAA